MWIFGRMLIMSNDNSIKWKIWQTGICVSEYEVMWLFINIKIMLKSNSLDVFSIKWAFENIMNPFSNIIKKQQVFIIILLLFKGSENSWKSHKVAFG